jgi:hypothetical protein
VIDLGREMIVILFACLGFVCGALAMFLALDTKRKRLDKLQEDTNSQLQEHQRHVEQLNLQREQFAQQMQGLKEQANKLNEASKKFDSKVVSYTDLQGENGLLKHDMRNIAVALRKLELDTTLQRQSQETLAEKVEEIAKRYLAENVKWISKSLNANNFASCKQRLLDVIE